jgi:hypothetical protein
MGRTCSAHVLEDECVLGFGGKVRRKEPLGICRRRLEDNIKMGFREIE